MNEAHLSQVPRAKQIYFSAWGYIGFCQGPQIGG